MYTVQNNRQREILRQLDRQEEEVGTDRCIPFRSIDRDREGQLDRQEEEVGTDRCIQLRTIDREKYLDSQIDRRRQVQIDVYNLKQ